ncbi:hypothetical protein N0V90_011783 [Kalmusia sp. IMI 367209]|nr:hypothetical protein N0V90_011783 [Kalmusia sp. IMI 367209]
MSPNTQPPKSLEETMERLKSASTREEKARAEQEPKLMLSDQGPTGYGSASRPDEIKVEVTVHAEASRQGEIMVEVTFIGGASHQKSTGCGSASRPGGIKDQRPTDYSSASRPGGIKEGVGDASHQGGRGPGIPVTTLELIDEAGKAKVKAWTDK